MAKKIGPGFDAELKQAGLLGLPFSWDADGNFTFGPGMQKAQIDAVLAVYAAHDYAASVAAEQTRKADEKAVLDSVAASAQVRMLHDLRIGDVDSWIDANVTSLSGAVTAMKLLVRLIVAAQRGLL